MQWHFCIYMYVVTLAAAYTMYMYIICFVWLKVTTSSIHFSLNIEQASCILVVLDICLSIKSWHGPKCHSPSSFSYCKEYLNVRNIFIPTLSSLWRLLFLYLIKCGFTCQYSLLVTSCSDFPKLCCALLYSLSAFILV